MFKIKKILPFLTIIALLFSTNSCGIYKKTDARKVSPDPDVRVQKNIAEVEVLNLVLVEKKVVEILILLHPMNFGELLWKS